MNEWSNKPNWFKDLYLGRLENDCNRYLDSFDRDKRYLYKHDEREHINLMRSIFYSIEPEDRNEECAEDISKLEKDMNKRETPGTILNKLGDIVNHYYITSLYEFAYNVFNGLDDDEEVTPDYVIDLFNKCPKEIL